MPQRTYNNSKDLILQAALRVISKKGYKGFTIDAVIHESELSKAGFFYNYQNKNQLLEALADRMINEWNQTILKLEKEDPEPIGRSLRAYIRYAIHQTDSKSSNDLILYQVFSEILFTQPEIFSDLSKKIGKNLPFNKDEGIQPDQALVVYLAFDGLWVQDSTPYYKLSPSHRKRALDLLLRMTHENVTFRRKK